MSQILTTISQLSNGILNTIRYASGLANSLRLKNFTAMSRLRGVSHDRVRRDLQKAAKERKEVLTVFQAGVQEEIRATAEKGALILDFTVAIKEHAKKIDAVVRQYAGSKTANGIAMGVIAWTNLKELILPVDLITWNKGDRPKNQTLMERAVVLAQRLGISTILADAFFATRHSFTCLEQAAIFAVMRFRSNISVFVEGFGKFQLRHHPAFKFKRNERCIIRNISWHGFRLRVIALKLFHKKSGWHVIFLVTNATMEKAQEYAAFYRHRWEIEPLFRYIKQVCGLEDCQARSIEMQESHFLACLFAYYSENINKPVKTPQKRKRKYFVPISRKKQKLKPRITRSMRYSYATA